MKAHLHRHQLICSFLRCGHAWVGTWRHGGEDLGDQGAVAGAGMCTALPPSDSCALLGPHAHSRQANGVESGARLAVHRRRTGGPGEGVGGDGGWHCGAHAHAHPVIGPCPITVGPAHLASSSRCGKKGVVWNGGARKGQRRTRAQTSVCTAAPTSHTTMANVQRQPSGRPPRCAWCAWTEECARHTRGAAVVAVETGEWCSAPQAAKRGALTTILYHVVGTAMLGHAPPRNGHRGGLTRR